MGNDGWDRQINSDGGTVADAARQELELIDYRLIRALEYLDLIADCLVAMAFRAAPDAGRRQTRLEELRAPRG